MAADAALEALKKHFGHTAFRGGQRQLVDALLEGRDVLGIMPTGAGKSVCYQVPALLLDGLTLVISPLISLMQDQVAALGQAGVPAAYLNSTLTPAQRREVLRRAALGAYRLLYVAPERLEGDELAALAQSVPIPLVAVDEAHCVSQWGQDFRPGYLNIAPFLARLPVRPVVGAFTATATDRVREDIVRLLQLRRPMPVVTGFDRPNLHFDVVMPEAKGPWLLRWVREHAGAAGIVYCSTRKTVEAVCLMLRKAGVAAAQYHAGLPEEERRAAQQDFLYDRVSVMVATNAFGMGIDKSNVSYVIHYNMPKDMESYYQEAGRAGRDGAAAQCVLLYSRQDVRTARFLIENPPEEDHLSPQERQAVLEKDLERLYAMVEYCEADGCLRNRLLRYFGENPMQECGNCGHCRRRTGGVELDVTTEAQMILSGAVRAYEMHGWGIGESTLVQMLRGSRDEKLLKMGLHRLPTYGIMSKKDKELIRRVMAELLARGCLVRTEGKYPVLQPGVSARGILFDGERLTLHLGEEEAEVLTCTGGKKKKQRRSAAAPTNGLYERLRQRRLELAQQQNVPPYVIFSNVTLMEMAEKQPQSMEAMRRISGVGEVKAARYGAAFLNAIEAWLQEPENGEAKSGKLVLPDIF